jgi:hypothetical protein
LFLDTSENISWYCYHAWKHWWCREEYVDKILDHEPHGLKSLTFQGHSPSPILDPDDGDLDDL